MSKTGAELSVETFPIGSLACNCSIIYSPKTREAIAIDCGNDLEQFLAKVKDLGVTVKYLLHTHAHFDHIGQADNIRKRLGCPLFLHQDDLFLYNVLNLQAAYCGEAVADPEGIDHFISDGEEFGLKLGGDLKDRQISHFLRAIHTPGHTPGSLSFYSEFFSEPILFSGDTLFARSIGRTDLPGGDADAIIRSIKGRILTLPEETRCIAGHGPDTYLYEESRNNPFLK